jgi:hypothetical protein
VHFNFSPSPPFEVILNSNLNQVEQLKCVVYYSNIPIVKNKKQNDKLLFYKKHFFSSKTFGRQ